MKKRKANINVNAQAKIKSFAYGVLAFLIEIPAHKEDNGVCNGFIELARMAWILINFLEMKAQGTSVTLPIISLFIRFPNRMKQAVIGVAMAISSKTCHILTLYLRQ